MSSYRNPGTAAILSFILPGLGQLYNGKFLRAILWFVLAGGTWIFTAGVFGWVIHILSAWGAYSYAKKHPYA